MIYTALFLMAGFIFCAGIMYFCLQYLFRYIYSYRITPTSIQVVFLGIIPVFWIRTENIRNIEICPKGRLWSPFDLAYRFGNRLLGTAILIKQETPWFLCREVIITPDNSKQFIQAVQEKMVELSKSGN